MFIINNINLVGRLVRDPDLKFTAGDNSKAVCTFTLAVDREYSKDGKKEADFLPIVVWGKQAENTATYMTKGKMVAISGRINTRNYENKEGTKVYITEIIASSIQFLDKKADNEKAETIPLSGKDITEVDDETIPF